jgi:hypothetical protein
MPLPVGTPTEPAGVLRVSDIAIRVKRQFGDEFGAQITDADILRWVNDAMRDIALRNNLLQVKAVTATVANQQDYTLPADMLTLHSVRYGTDKLQSLTLSEADTFMDTTSSNAGTPVYYSQWGSTISLYPIPSDAATSLNIYYTRQPVVVDDLSDAPELPAAYHLRLVEYCIAQAYELDSEPESYAQKMAQFNQNVDSTKDNGEWQNREFYPNITVSLEDTVSGGWDY